MQRTREPAQLLDLIADFNRAAVGAALNDVVEQAAQMVLETTTATFVAYLHRPVPAAPFAVTLFGELEGIDGVEWSSLGDSMLRGEAIDDHLTTAMHAVCRTVRDDRDSAVFVALSDHPFEDPCRQFIDAATAVLCLAADRSALREDLRRATTDFDDAQALAGFGTYNWHIPTDTNHWSDQLYRIYGAEPQSFNASYERFLGFIHEEDRAAVQEVHAEAFRTLEPYRTVERIVRPDGEIRYLSTSGEVIADENGVPERVAGVCVDVTDMHLAAEQTRASIDQMSAVLAASPDAVLVVDSDGTVEQANPQAALLFGCPEAELVGRPVGDLIPEPLPAASGGPAGDPATRPVVVGLGTIARRNDGTTLLADVHASRLDVSVNGRVALFIRDASERLQAQRVAVRLDVIDNRRRQALEINDNVVQGLASAGYALESGDIRSGQGLVDATLDSARAMMDDLLAEVTSEDLDRTHLVRDVAASSSLARAPERPQPGRETPIATTATTAPPEPTTTATTAVPQPATTVLIVDDSSDIRLLVRIGLEMAGLDVVAEGEDGQHGIELAGELRPDVVIMDIAMPRMDGLTALGPIRDLLPDATIIILSGFGQDRMGAEALERGADLYLEKGQPIDRLVTEIERRHGPATPMAPPLRDGTARDDRTIEPAVPTPRVFAPPSLTHAIGTPLAIVGGMVSALRSGGPAVEGTSRDDMLAAIDRNVGRLNGILDTVKEARDAQEGRIVLDAAPFDLASELRALTGRLEGLHEHALTLTCPPTVQVTLDLARVQQILANLVTNAAKFSPQGTPIAVSLRVIDDQIEIEVDDQGPGVPIERRARLFEPYERLTDGGPPGLGLGLYVARALARQHGGDISHVGLEPHGARFTLRLPLHATATGHAEADASRSDASQAHERAVGVA